MRERIANDTPIYDDTDTPDGVVGRRAPEQEPEQPTAESDRVVIDLGEISDEAYADLVARRVIDDGDEGEIEIDVAELAGEMLDPEEFPMLLAGDVVYAKVHHPVRFDDEPSNFTYGVAARVQPGESEDDAFERIEPIVNTRALMLAQRAHQPIRAFKNEVYEANKAAVDERRKLRPRNKEGE